MATGKQMIQAARTAKMQVQIARLTAERDEARAERDALAEALRWHASDEAWTVREVEGPYGDYGRRARDALARLAP